MSKKRIFVASPIGEEDSPQRKRADQLLKHIISPVVDELSKNYPEGIELFRSDKISEPGRITIQVLKELSESDILIADLTETNPNVMYELGIRQAIMKPYVLMAAKGQSLPFDLSDFRTIFYLLDLDGVEVSQNELRKQLEKALQGEVSIIDQNIFKKGELVDGPEVLRDNNILVVLEACNQILREVKESKDLLIRLGNINLNLNETLIADKQARKEEQNQQMGMFMFQKFLEHPDSIEKIMPAVKMFADLGIAQQQINSSNDAEKVNKRPKKN